MIYLARFHCGTLRKFRATNPVQAMFIASGLAKSNNWTLRSVGKA